MGIGDRQHERPRTPSALTPPLRDPRPYAVSPQPRTLEPRWSRRHSAHDRPPRAPTAPPRLSGMLCRHTAAVNRQVDASGPAGSAGMTPRGAGTTASVAALDDRIRTRAGGSGALPRSGAAQVREDLPDDGGIVEGGFTLCRCVPLHGPPRRSILVDLRSLAARSRVQQGHLPARIEVAGSGTSLDLGHSAHPPFTDEVPSRDRRKQLGRLLEGHQLLRSRAPASCRSPTTRAPLRDVGRDGRRGHRPEGPRVAIPPGRTLAGVA